MVDTLYLNHCIIYIIFPCVTNGQILGLICGVLFGLCSGQPLILLGSTGPVYVFEKILYQLCSDQGWDYLSLRLWIGLWVAAILILLVAIDASAYVCYITRYKYVVSILFFMANISRIIDSFSVLILFYFQVYRRTICNIDCIYFHLQCLQKSGPYRYG